MDGSKPMMPDDLDRELAAALRVQPSGDFRARIRARVTSEQMQTAALLQPVVAACASLAALAVLGLIWLLTPLSLPVPDAPPVTRLPALARLPEPSIDRQTPLRAATPPARTGLSTTPVPQVAAVPVRREPEVLLPESERAGVRLLFEALAAGRLELPEDMLQDLSLPIVEARTGAHDLDSPWTDSSEGDVR